ncbi:HNH endonuclease [Phycicoccus sp. MQZ13P-5]|uniref:HNH endonuclease n=1 Tax=Phycicoccus sonneratiae TaxID=2807628 RepID=A0ABS2CL27_9MICO|nr:HNH endonuclease [Phycicoccus sonneraticus]
MATLDAGALSDHERVALVCELERLKGAAAACQARATDALRLSREVAAPQDVARSVGSEVALARREAPSSGDRFVGLSRALVHELPCLMAALTGGLVDERAAVEVVRETATLTREDRGEVDRRIASALPHLSARAAGRAAARVAAELDAGSVVRRMEAAVRSRRVTVRPAPDGMAYLTVLGPLREVVGAHAALLRRARSVVGGQCAEEAPEGRGVGAVSADTALGLLSGVFPGRMQPVEVQLVITDRALLGTGDPHRSVDEPARIPAHGSVPAPVARAWVRGAGPASAWLRRLYTSPDGRDLVAMDSRRRVFLGGLRRMVVLRDDVCTTPFCDAPIVHADHAHPARDGGSTSALNGNGKCSRCNLVKEAPGWEVVVERASPHEIVTRTPTGHSYRSLAPPLLGWGSETHPPPDLPVAGSSLPGDSVLERRLDWFFAASA